MASRHFTLPRGRHQQHARHRLNAPRPSKTHYCAGTPAHSTHASIQAIWTHHRTWDWLELGFWSSSRRPTSSFTIPGLGCQSDPGLDIEIKVPAARASSRLPPAQSFLLVVPGSCKASTGLQIPADQSLGYKYIVQMLYYSNGILRHRSMFVCRPQGPCWTGAGNHIRHFLVQRNALERGAGTSALPHRIHIVPNSVKQESP